jgi:hypothetical protein
LSFIKKEPVSFLQSQFAAALPAAAAAQLALGARALARPAAACLPPAALADDAAAAAAGLPPGALAAGVARLPALAADLRAAANNIEAGGFSDAAAATVIAPRLAGEALAVSRAVAGAAAAAGALAAAAAGLAAGEEGKARPCACSSARRGEAAERAATDAGVRAHAARGRRARRWPRGPAHAPCEGLKPVG